MKTSFSEKVQNFVADHEDETHTGEEWESIAQSEGLTSEEIDELFDYLDEPDK